ncbi:CHAP domain-containing protein [Kordia sp. YSTF-M3]|uniref:CHAP domain-containing protein n=1 Tax=Kordia aestuariivivens TaxID=2759037 RepID=A0ABR7Q683_9FLAO|nr:CHAP domain-containing protein [Kordia aestuariivivens]MBC8754050.1 CHAP domain-containing protein [Kordia aestuariivivens]
MKRKFLLFFILIGFCIGLLKLSQHVNINPFRTVGEELDAFNNVSVYYNGAVNHVETRNVTKDGYNLGLEFQCVEFVKRYYYEYLQHKMPDSYGHAKDFFNPNVKDGKLNTQRNLIQYTNGSSSKPKTNDILVFTSSWYNSFGHVAIVTKVVENKVFIIQQNAGPFSNTRISYDLTHEKNCWKIPASKIVGWLRKE